MFQFATVSFLPDEDEGSGNESIEVIPTKWITDDEKHAHWPEISNKGCSRDRRTRLIMGLTSPQKDWPKRRINVRHRFGKFNAVGIKLSMDRDPSGFFLVERAVILTLHMSSQVFFSFGNLFWQDV